MLDKRSVEILEEIITAPYINVEYLQRKFNLSKAQVNYSIEKINSYLIETFGQQIEKNAQGEILISNDLVGLLQKETLSIHQFEFSGENRICIILLIVLTIPNTSFQDIMYFVKISKNTVSKVIKETTNYLMKFHLRLDYSRKNGFELIGKEFDKRLLLLNIIDKLSLTVSINDVSIILLQIQESEIKELKQRLSMVEKELHLKLTDQAMSSLPYVFAILYKRIERKEYIEPFDENYKIDDTTSEYKATRLLMKNYDIPNNEFMYFSLLLLTANSVYVDGKEPNESDLEILLSVYEMIRLFEVNSCVRVENKEVLAHYIYQHWRVSYYRIKYGFPIENVLLDEILEKYYDLYQLITKSIDPFTKLLGKPLPKEEIGYLVILLGGWLKKYEFVPVDVVAKRAVVVCQNGIALSHYIYIQLQELFPSIQFLGTYSKREFYNLNETFDYVFSNVRLETSKLVFYCNSFLSNEEKSRLARQVEMASMGIYTKRSIIDSIIDVIGENATLVDEAKLRDRLIQLLYQPENERKQLLHKNLSLLDILQQDQIFMSDETDWKKLFTIGCKPMIDSGAVENRYLQAMISQVVISKAYILVAPGVAIAHAGIHQGVHNVSMSLVVNKTYVNIHDYMEADIILVLATPRYDIHLQALREFTDFCDESNNLQQLRACKSIDEILKLLEGRIKNGKSRND